MTWLIVAVVLVVAAAGLLRCRRPAWYWLIFGVTLAALRVLIRYASVMEACGLTVPPSRWRLALARATNRPIPGPRAPRILRLRPTRTGLLIRPCRAVDQRVWTRRGPSSCGVLPRSTTSGRTSPSLCSWTC